MTIRRQGRLHQTIATQQSEVYWDYQPDQRVMTIDGPGRVIAVSDGPFPGSEEYEIRLEGGLGGGTYTPGQITAATSVEAVEHHTADQDYPELGTILYDRPDPATIRHTAELGSGGGDGGSSGDGGSPAPSSAQVASGDADESGVGWDPGEYNNAMYHDWRIAAQDPGPNDIARSLDKFKDAQEERHQDDARFATNWEPLHNSSIPAAEHGGWMFMEHKGEQPRQHNPFSSDRSTTTPPLTTYKHGITRENLHLDPRGVPWTHQGGGEYQISAYNADNHLRRRGHYDLLDQMKATPETAYGDDYKRERNKRLMDNGWNVVSSVTASTLPDDHPDKVYLRFGHWPEDERSENYVTGGREEGVSVYDLDHKGEPMDPDPHYSRGHEHDEHCEPDCDLDWNNSEFGNDTHEEMNGRVSRAEKGRRNDYDLPHQVGHLVKGKMVGIGHDGEPLINNVKRVGDWIDHRHHFIPGADKHPLARDEDDEGYEAPEGKPQQLKPFEAKSTVEDEDFDEDAMCGVQHDGTCEEAEHGSSGLDPRTAMPSKRYPEHPEGFETQIGHYNSDWGHKRSYLGAFVNGQRAGSIHYTPYNAEGMVDHDADPEDVHGLKVDLLHTGRNHPVDAHVRVPATGGSRGVASAMMDHLHSTFPHALINHGSRTDQGIKWWNNYEDPAPERNVHKLPPHEWDHLWDRDSVAEDIGENEAKNPGHHDQDDIGWAQDHASYYGEQEDEHEPHPADQAVHRGIQVHLSPEDHRYVHDPTIPDEHRAHHLLNLVGRGNMPEYDWHTSVHSAHHQAANDHVQPVGDTFGNDEKTRVVLHGDFTTYGNDEPTRDFDHNANSDSFDMSSDKKPRNFHLTGMTWTKPSGGRSSHDFSPAQPVAIPPDDSRIHHPMDRGHQDAAKTYAEHEERTAPVEVPGMHDTRGQQSLFATAHLTLGPSPEDRAGLKSHLLSHHGFTNDQISMLDDPGQGDDLVMEHHLEHNANADDGISGEFGRGEIEHSKVEHDHKGKGGIANRFPQTTEFNFSGTPQGHYLSSLIAMAAMDGEFRFHVTAAWRDVQAKAVRIRKAGGVQITHSSDAMVIANVQGDHHVYETGLQRVPGRRTAVAVYSCGCKWGAYHWGADDDMSRFAGRMCSHALALQYEAQARGMFGRDVSVDDTKPRWVPSKVVVKYDIDEGKNIQARSSLVVPEQAPLLAVLALADQSDPGFGVVLAAVNDMFGDQTGMTEPTGIDPAGPTTPWNKDENPTSAGVLAGGEPSNWGRINSPSMYPRLGTASEGDGVEATFHEEPEPALPSTDGHTASMGDVDLAETPGIGTLDDDALSPENPSMQAMGVQDIVAAFQRSAGAKHLMAGSKAGDTSTSDIAGAAAAYLQKTAASATEFSLAEREALINESPGVQASNTDRLDIEGTHYAELERHAMNEEDDDLWMA